MADPDSFYSLCQALIDYGLPKMGKYLQFSLCAKQSDPAAQGQTSKDSLWYRTGMLEENNAEAWGVVCRKGKIDLGRSQLSSGGVNCTLTDKIKKGCRGSIIWGRSSKITGALWSGGIREECIKKKVAGGGIGMGNTCKSMADSFQCVTKPTTIL